MGNSATDTDSDDVFYVLLHIFRRCFFDAGYMAKSQSTRCRLRFLQEGRNFRIPQSGCH